MLTSDAYTLDDHARQHMRPPLFVRADRHADDVLPLLRRHRQTVAIMRAPSSEVVIGIVTQENILNTVISGALPPAAKAAPRTSP